MTNNSIEDIKNTDLFKYSPYNTLTTEQNEVCKEIIYDIIEKLSNNEQGTSVINGGAGTGKTIILINMIYKLINASKFDVDFSEEDDALTESTKMLHSLKEFISNYEQQEREKTGIKTLKVGYNKVFGYYIEISKY